MAWGLPSGSSNKGRSRNTRAAQRRVKPAEGKTAAGKLKGSQPPLTRPPTVAPGPATHTQQPVTAPQPTNVLGGHAGPTGTSFTGESRINTGMPEAAVTGGGERIGKRFTVGFDRAGNIVHLYGNDVPADQRRQVLKRR